MNLLVQKIKKEGRASPSHVQIFMLVTSVLFIWFAVSETEGCNEAVCASIVSKCILTESCKCDISRNESCICCKDCFNCLSYLFDECCSCLDLCPDTSTSDVVIVDSQVGHIKESFKDLFRELTGGDASVMEDRWTTFTYPIDLDVAMFQPKTEESEPSEIIKVRNIIVDPSRQKVTVNCTVAFMSVCMPLNKCQSSCQSMGASYYRWFHDGCCECCGHGCISYGIDESRCQSCSMSTSDDAEDDEDDLNSPYH